MVVIHRTTQDAFLLCRRLKMFLNGVRLKTDSLSLLEFENSGLQIHFRFSSNPSKATGSESVGRGLPQVSLAIFDEAAHQSNLKECVTVLAPALTWSDMGLMVFIGTASSKQSYFYETLTNAAESEQNLENLLSGVRAGDLEPFQVLNRGTGGVGVVTHWKAIERFKNEPDFLGRVQDEFSLADSQIATEYSLDFASAVDSACFDFSQIMAAQVDELEPSKNTARKVYYLGIDSCGIGRDWAVALALEKFRDEEDNVTYTVRKLYRKKTGTSEQHLSAIRRHD